MIVTFKKGSFRWVWKVLDQNERWLPAALPFEFKSCDTSFCTSWWRAQVGVNDLVFFLVDVRVKPTRVMILRRESRIIESL